MALTTVSPGLLDTTAQYYGFKNRIINGAMGIWQRGTTGTSGYTSVDRWLGLNTTSFNRSTDVPTGFQYSLEFGNASATYIITDQRIESVNCYDLVGHRVTVSFWAKNVSGASWIGAELYYANALDNFSATTIFDSKTWLSPSSSWTQYTFTSNVVVPANGANGLVLRIYRNTDTASTTRITGVQLEKGSTATSFDYRPYGTELQLCQRYFYRNGGSNIWQSHTLGVFTGSLTLDAPFYFPVPFRASPSLTVNTIGSLLVVPNGYTISSLVIQDGPSTNSTQLLLRATTSGSPALGNAARILSNNNASASLDFSAEL
jgi:hypothetical protein